MTTPQNPLAAEQSADNKTDLSSTRSNIEAAPLSEEECLRLEKSVIRKVDWRMLPLLGTLSALSLVDRSNLGLARIVGMDHDLHLRVGARYSIVSCIYFVPYILLELPSNISLRKLGAINWLAFLVVSWGLVQLSMGFVPTWGYLALCRVLLGAFEAGFFPALVYIITTWWVTSQTVNIQIAVNRSYIFTGIHAMKCKQVGVVIGGFSAIFAYALSLLAGKLDISGWAWIFIIEGAITVVFGIIAWFLLPGFPDQNTFLTQEETALILQRVEQDRGDSLPDVLTKEKVIRYLLDWKIWAISMMYMCATLPAYAISFFVTNILLGMGWSVTASLLLAISILFFAWISDKYRQRAAIIAFQAIVTIVGLVLTGYAKQSSIFLSTAGSGGCIPGILAYSSNNIISHTKKSVSTAIIVSFGGIGGMFASLVFRQVDAPAYRPGIYVTIGSQLLMLLLLAITTTHFWRKNKSMAQELLYMDSNEKNLEHSKESSISSKNIESADSEDDVAFERKTMRYVDWRILPVLALVYSFALIDRINMGAALTAGMGVDLKLLIENRFSIVNCLYFVPYTLLQLPGNLVLRYFGVRNWLTFIVLAWGAVQLSMGFVHSWGFLVLCRVLLGIFEASFFPSLLFIISTWLSIFYLLSVTAGGLSPILAYVFSLLKGRGGLAGWRYIFIIEGAITMFLAIITWLFIPSFPDQNNFLTAKQTAVVLKRIDEDRGDAIPDALTFEKVKMHLSDWTLWAYDAQSYFLPSILKGMGWSQTKSLLLSAPPYGPSIITTMIVAYFSDKQRHRCGYIVLGTGVCLTGLCLTAFAKQNSVRYFGAYLINAGNSGVIPTILAYASNNVVSHTKRSVQTALTVSLGGIGGILATTVFRTQDAPHYFPGLGATIGSQVLLLTLLGATTLRFMWLNKAMREGKRKEPLEGQPGFYYTL
ncbi:hypothetical protein CVT25_008221 [Psilocybe cyanescens]|uniref:Major facilitator superfamily (MFS) profile domain-containing protein n=1 Tax=Psilocybe cyanescens TaxID=93625 RepID=A0A409X9R9_PSICY|nr:hypothetical protein CVT25_008221 [Psilocybe cyanescens]